MERAKIPFGKRIVKRKACVNVFEIAFTTEKSYTVTETWKAKADA